MLPTNALAFDLVTEIAINETAPTVVSVEIAPTVHRDRQTEVLRGNRDVDWESFDPGEYWKINYQTLRNDDQSIIEIVGEFFSRHFGNASQAHSLRGLDVGSGGNLYPALGLLPWSATVTLTDISQANLTWLAEAAAGIGADDRRGRWVWQPFWAEYARYPGYRQLLDPREQLANRCEIRRRAALDLEPAGWDLGSMFFTAESTTSYQREFTETVGAFLRALVPGAPFSAAFMDSSIGYTVADRPFPAVREVDVPLVRKMLAEFSAEATVIRVDVLAHDPARDGYEGMIVATGITAG